MAPVNDRNPRNAQAPEEGSAARILDELLRLATQTADRLDPGSPQPPERAAGAGTSRSPTPAASEARPQADAQPNASAWESSLRRIMQDRDTSLSNGPESEASVPANPNAPGRLGEVLSAPELLGALGQARAAPADAIQQPGSTATAQNLMATDLAALLAGPATADARPDTGSQGFALPPVLTSRPPEPSSRPGEWERAIGLESRSRGSAEIPPAPPLARAESPPLQPELGEAQLDSLSRLFATSLEKTEHAAPERSTPVASSAALRSSSFSAGMPLSELLSRLEPFASSSPPIAPPTHGANVPAEFPPAPTLKAILPRSEGIPGFDPCLTSGLGDASPFSSPMLAALSQPPTRPGGGLAALSTTDSTEPPLPLPAPPPALDTSNPGVLSDSGRDTDLLRLQLDELRLTNQLLRQDRSRPLPAEPRGGRPSLSR